MKRLLMAAICLFLSPSVVAAQDVDSICPDCGRPMSQHVSSGQIGQLDYDPVVSQPVPQRLPVLPRVAVQQPVQTYAIPLRIPRPTYQLRYSGVVYVDALGNPVRRGPVRLHRNRPACLRLPRLVW